MHIERQLFELSVNDASVATNLSVLLWGPLFRTHFLLNRDQCRLRALKLLIITVSLEGRIFKVLSAEGSLRGFLFPCCWLGIAASRNYAVLHPEA